MLIIIRERIIGSSRIFNGCLGPVQFEVNKCRVGDEGAERAVETAGGPVGLVIIRTGCMLPVTTFMRRRLGMR